MSRVVLFLSRALRLRCPACGGPAFLSWFSMRETCTICGLRFEREEGYFTGAMAVNLIVAELVFAAGLAGSFYATHPDTPGNWVYGWILVMVLGPLALYPFSKTIWLAFDLLFRPTRNSEADPELH